jgi:hypothetical protein
LLVGMLLIPRRKGPWRRRWWRTRRGRRRPWSWWAWYGVFGGGHGGGGLGGRTTPVPDSPMSTEGAYRSTGGPGEHVPTGLSGEAARHAARESARTEQANTAHESPRKTTPSKTAVKITSDFHLLL